MNVAECVYRTDKQKWRETFVTKHQSFDIFALQRQMKAFYPKSSLFSIRNDSASTVTQ